MRSTFIAVTLLLALTSSIALAEPSLEGNTVDAGKRSDATPILAGTLIGAGLSTIVVAAAGGRTDPLGVWWGAHALSLLGSTIGTAVFNAPGGSLGWAVGGWLLGGLAGGSLLSIAGFFAGYAIDRGGCVYGQCAAVWISVGVAEALSAFLTSWLMVAGYESQRGPKPPATKTHPPFQLVVGNARVGGSRINTLGIVSEF
jgi:hypothetical protein